MLVLGALSAFQYGRPQPAGASPAPATLAAAHRAPAHEICTDQGAKSLCANRDGGGTAENTPVIAWSAGDNNNDFEWSFLVTDCNHGTVSVSPPCPFQTAALNSQFRGKFIASLFNISTGLCVGNSNNAQNNPFGDLEQCPAVNGAGGGWGTVFVLPDIINPMSPNTTYAVNRFWSDAPSGGNGSAKYLCPFGRGLKLWLDGSQQAGVCQWNQL
jgi:hypothetical protein